MGIGHNLKLDVARVDDELFKIHLVIVKAGTSLGPGLFKQVAELRGIEDLAHTAAAATGSRLNKHGVANLIGNALGFFHSGHRAI